MKITTLLAALTAVLFLLGCQGKGGDFQRGQFIGYVQDKTEEEVTGKVGKPDSVDAANPNVVKWVYKNKTFDPDNNNQVDPQITLIFQKDASGKLKVTQVIF